MGSWRARGAVGGWLAFCAVAAACSGGRESTNGEVVPGVVEPAKVIDAGRSPQAGEVGADARAAGANATEPMVPSCGAWPPTGDMPWPVRACVMWDDLPERGELEASGVAQRVLDFTGRVVELTKVTADEQCLGFIALNGALLSGMGQLDPRWLHLEDSAGKRVTVGVLAPAFEWPLSQGDAISVTVEMASGGFVGIPLQQILLRSASGELLAWFAEAYTVDGFHTPRELQLRLGAVACLGHHNCSPTWAEYDLEVQLAGMQPDVLGRGQQRFVGDYSLVHGGVFKDLEGGRCPEMGLDRAQVALWRTR